ncbi:hypothetical protein [Nostoc cycadae]|uniref:ABC transporter n=1 Tax=Nostoc cycadae WK-1 TaxID=1861711 RepID=A0A2H6LDW0_9NOSO|nr:hypothetical protein [Nostoc cycadae]GBE91425.1 ABC transporter [Nostoc cycadae WK-1]
MSSFLAVDMIYKSLSPRIFLTIKFISICLITGALGLELANLYIPLNKIFTLPSLNIILTLERFALITHFLEAVIAVFYAHSKNKIPLNYGVYTFFVGTIGLLELFNNEDI